MSKKQIFTHAANTIVSALFGSALTVAVITKDEEILDAAKDRVDETCLALKINSCTKKDWPLDLSRIEELLRLQREENFSMRSLSELHAELDPLNPKWAYPSDKVNDLDPLPSMLEEENPPNNTNHDLNALCRKLDI